MNHDRLIERILAGELSPESSEVREACRDAAFARELEEVMSILDSIERDAVLEEAGTLRDVPGEEQAAQWMRDKLAPAAPRIPLPLLLTAAAMFLAILVPTFLGGVGRTPRVPDVTLGEVDLECVTPRGRGRFDRFRWKSNAEHGTFVVHVYDAESGEELSGGRSLHLRASISSWRPDPADVADWPDRIEWEIEWHEPGGPSRRVASSSAWR